MFEGLKKLVVVVKWWEMGEGVGVGGIDLAVHFVGDDCWVTSTVVVVGELVVGVLASLVLFFG